MYKRLSHRSVSLTSCLSRSVIRESPFCLHLAGADGLRNLLALQARAYVENGGYLVE